MSFFEVSAVESINIREAFDVMIEQMIDQNQEVVKENRALEKQVNPLY